MYCNYFECDSGLPPPYDTKLRLDLLGGVRCFFLGGVSDLAFETPLSGDKLTEADFGERDTEELRLGVLWPLLPFEA